MVTVAKYLSPGGGMKRIHLLPTKVMEKYTVVSYNRHGMGCWLWARTAQITDTMRKHICDDHDIFVYFHEWITKLLYAKYTLPFSYI